MTIQLPIDCPSAMPMIDLHDLLEDTHRQFAALRAKHAVVCWGERRYMVLRAADVIELTTDPRIQSMPGEDYVTVTGIPGGSIANMLTEGMLLDNGLSHRLKRGLFSRTFSHRSIAEMRPVIRAVADRLVADLPRGEPFDFVEAMASRLPAEMIATVLGLPMSETDYFTARVYSVARALTPLYPIEDHYAIDNAAGELFDYVKHHLHDRLRAPKDDFLTSLVQQWRESDTISFDSLVQQVTQLIIGGSDTTRAAFAILVALLLAHREQWYAVRANRLLIGGAVMEGLRYEPSVASVARYSRVPIEIGGNRIPAGSMVTLQNMSAMRDPALYQDPDRFDITRVDHPRLHLVFGGGPHRCIGEMLARLEMEEGLAALLEAVPGIELLDMPRMSGIGGIRQITPMMVRID